MFCLHLKRVILFFFIMLLFEVRGFVHAVLYAPQVFMLWMKTEWRCDVPEWVHI